MEELEPTSNIDHVTELPKDVLSFLIFTFFPTSNRHFRYREIFCGDAIDDDTNNESTKATGSLPEHLDLPMLLQKTKDGTVYIMPDTDLMFNVRTGHMSSVLTVGVRPGYCKVGVLKENADTFEIEVIRPGEFLEIVKKAVNLMGGGIQNTGKMFLIDEINAPRNQEKNYRQRTKMGDENFTTEIVSAPILQTSYAFGHTDINQSCDFVSSLAINIPEEIALNFIERIEGKAWPPLDTVMEGFLEGCHAIPKKNPLDTEGHDWRISFSVLEVKLAKTLNDTQRICYRVLKAVVMSEINEDAAEGEKLASYFLKTTLFWLCEEMHPDLFVQKNIANIWIALLDRIIHSVSDGSIRNYFVPDCNMIEHISPNIKNCWLVKLQYIRNNPVSAFRKFWSLFHLNTYVCQRGTWEKYYLDALELMDQVNEDRTIPLLAKRTIQPIMAFYTLDSNLTDWKKCVDFCQNVSYSGPSGIMDSFGGSIFSYLLNGSLGQIYNALLIGLDREDSHVFADLGCIRQHQLIVEPWNHFDVTAEQLFSAAVNKSVDTPLVAVVKYANYLRSQGRYEDLTALVIKYLKRILPVKQKYLSVFSQFTPLVLDEYMRWALWSLPEITFSSDLLLYYFLILGYQKAGVLAEVFMPGYFIPEYKTGWNHIQRVADYGVIWASLLCHAKFYDSAFLCCLCDPTRYFYIYLKGILHRFMYKCIAELFLQMKKEHMAPSSVFDRQRQLRQTWSAAMMEFPQKLSLTEFEGLTEQQEEQMITECTETIMQSSTE